MGIYKVQANGKAPGGLAVGDLVVTGGGTYRITGVNSDGSYTSEMYNAAQTTYNFTGAYNSPGSGSSVGSGSGGSGSSVSGSGGSSSGGSGGYGGSGNKAAGDELKDWYLDLVKQQPAAYQPLTGAAPAQSISFAEAIELAEQVMSPQYEQRYQQAADSAAQRLDKAGLYDTLYGQSLAAEAENAVSRDLNAAIYALALQLSDASEENARRLLELAVKERQFGANYDAEQKSQAMQYLLKLLGS